MKGNDGSGDVVDRDEWETPQWLFDKLNEQYGFNVDCCSVVSNSKCVGRFNDFLLHVGDYRYKYWMNPPFSKSKEMFEHFFKVVSKGVAIYRCDNFETKIWQETIFPNSDWVFVFDKRINYEGEVGSSARFPSALVGVGVEPPRCLKGVVLFVE